jgi:hypothetical protein
VQYLENYTPQHLDGLLDNSRRFRRDDALPTDAHRGRPSWSQRYALVLYLLCNLHREGMCATVADAERLPLSQRYACVLTPSR